MLRLVLRYLVAASLFVALAWTSVTVKIGQETLYGHVYALLADDVEDVIARLRQLDDDFEPPARVRPTPAAPRPKPAPAPTEAQRRRHDDNAAHLRKVAALSQPPTAAPDPEPRRPVVEGAATARSMDALVRSVR